MKEAESTAKVRLGGEDGFVLSLEVGIGWLPEDQVEVIAEALGDMAFSRLRGGPDRKTDPQGVEEKASILEAMAAAIRTAGKEIE